MPQKKAKVKPAAAKLFDVSLENTTQIGGKKQKSARAKAGEGKQKRTKQEQDQDATKAISNNSDTESSSSEDQSSYVENVIDRYRYTSKKSNPSQSNKGKGAMEIEGDVNPQKLDFAEKKSGDEPQPASQDQPGVEAVHKFDNLSKIRNIKSKLTHLLQKQQDSQEQEWTSRSVKYWVEVYDSGSEDWILMDPLDNKILQANSQEIQDKLEGMPVIFILTGYEASFNSPEVKQHVCSERNYFSNLFIFDTTCLYLEQWLKIYQARNIYSISKSLPFCVTPSPCMRPLPSSSNRAALGGEDRASCR